MTGRTWDGLPLTPGVNVDPVDIAAGLAKAHELGYDTAHHDMVLTYALQRHARGEEDGAVRTAMDPDHGVGSDFTSWRVILAAAVAAGTATLTAATG